MMFSTNSILSLAAAGLMMTWSCNAMPKAQYPTEEPTTTLPATCSTTIDDWEHTTAWVTGPSCYTYTKTMPSAGCSSCIQPSTQACPLIISVTTIEVPCANDCCPLTPTVYKETACPTCVPCPIPTETVTMTTGCASSGSASGYPSPTSY